MFINSDMKMISSYVELANQDVAENSFIKWFDQVSDGGQKKEEAVCALWIATVSGNQRLVSYIVDHSAKDAVNAYVDSQFLLCSAWSPVPSRWQLTKEKSFEQSMECVRLLVDAGADVNANFWKRSAGHCLCNVSIPESSSSNIRTVKVISNISNLLGRIVFVIINLRSNLEKAMSSNDDVRIKQINAEIKEKMQIGAFLTALGAKIEAAEISKNQSTSQEFEANKKAWEDYNFQVVNEMQLIFWEKTRLVYLAKKSPTSVFANVPIELIAIIGQKTTELSLLPD